MDFSVKKMRAEDIEQIARLEALCFSEPWSENALSAELDTESALFLVAYSGNELAGYVGSHLVLDEAELTDIAVYPQFRRSGAASALLGALCKELVQRGAAYLYLEVRQSNASAIRLYEKEGFECTGVRKGFYSHPREDAITYIRRFE